MKTVKITLAVIVVATIISAAIFGFMSLSESGEIQLPKNQFIRKIEQKIDSLKRMPESSFCDSQHKEIKYYIEDDYVNKRFGKTQLENDQWKNNLSSNLYAAYTDKFIKQAFYVFKGSEWEVKKLNFIRTEYKTLQNDGQKTGMLEKNSNIDKMFNEIKNIFLKYDEIANFINSCKTFSVKQYDISTTLPLSTIQAYIIRSQEYLKNNLENYYVENCTQLKADLGEVPQYLFKAHVKYIENNIKFLENNYKSYPSQRDYYNNLYQPIEIELNKLDNNIYNINNFDEEFQKLKEKLDVVNNDIYPYFNY